jgi:hypothetical protein
LATWFRELHATREYMMVAGFGGGQVLPMRISYTEIRSWAELTDNRPIPWEVATLRRMDDEYLAAKNGSRKTGKQHQALGEYCQGKEIETCRKTFGEMLERVCSTCPN